MALVTPTPITSLPIPPSTSDPTNFDTRGDAFLGALPTFQTEANALADNAYENAQWAETKASEAAASEANAAASEASAEASAVDSALAAGAPVWNAATNYSTGAAAYSTVTRMVYRRLVSGIYATDPSSDTTRWVPSSQANVLHLQFISLGII